MHVGKCAVRLRPRRLFPYERKSEPAAIVAKSSPDIDEEAYDVVAAKRQLIAGLQHADTDKTPIE
jgi:hypothetical protein